MSAIVARMHSYCNNEYIKTLIKIQTLEAEYDILRSIII